MENPGGLNAVQVFLDSFLESMPVVAFMSCITLWALFSDNIRLAGTRYSADTGFDTLTSIIFFLFVSEIVLSAYCKPTYRGIIDLTIIQGETKLARYIRLAQVGSFYMWLDILATLSLMFEVRSFHNFPISNVGSNRRYADYFEI